MSRGAAAPGTLIISTLPRLSRSGGSALVAIDPEALQLVAMRRFPESEYLASGPSHGRTIEHCRGLARSGETIFVGMFNSVRAYAVRDARQLELTPAEVYTAAACVDVHGIAITHDRLFASSTGADAVIWWSLVTGDSGSIDFSRRNRGVELRFPARRALEDGQDDWREALPAQLHINGVASIPTNGLVVCSLHAVHEVNGFDTRTLFDDDSALLHDACRMRSGELLMSDAAAGDLVILERESGGSRRIHVGNPRHWFVRGLTVVGSNAIVLRSTVGETEQRRVQTSGRRTRRGARLGVSIVDLNDGTVTREETIDLMDVDAGSVAYDVQFWSEIP